MSYKKFFGYKFNRAVVAGLFFGLALILTPFLVRAESYGDQKIFNIDDAYDTGGRSKLNSTLVWAGTKLNFYVDDVWWAGLNSGQKSGYNDSFEDLDREFNKVIYPKLTLLYGSDIDPAIDRGGKITILVHPMVKDAGGYINTGDGYLRSEVPTSNEREMIYMNTRFIDSPLAKSYIAHEFTHIITFNQKDRLRNISEDIWLNEARADYASTILGYDIPYTGSNFEQRIRSYNSDSSKSLVEWLNKPANYGAAHLFMQYIVDQYGAKILTDSMALDKKGIESINYALQKNNKNIDFNQVFRNWVVALAANDCGLGAEYCYKYSDLKNFTITPRINYLPTSEQSSLSVMYNTSYFAGNWQKIVGGGGDLTLSISSDVSAKFRVPYLLCYSTGDECRVGDLELDENGKATLKLSKFGQQYASLTLMPFATGKTAGFNNFTASNVSYSLKIEVSAPQEAAGGGQDDPEIIKKLTQQVEYLKNEILRIQGILAARLKSQNLAVGTVGSSTYSCAAINGDLYFGVENSSQVKCLQEFLKGQGAQIYPQGVVSGSFSTDTRTAVIRFQEKYASRVLIPLGLTSGTGYVGVSTRKIINQMLAG